MKRTALIVVTVAAALMAACTPPPPPAVAPAAEDRYLIDPRSGYSGTAAPRTAEQFDAAWRLVMAGDYTQARLRLAELHKRDAQYAPAELAEAAIAIREEKLDEARAIVERLPHYTASDVYAAEIAFRQHDTRRAYDLYRALARTPGAPVSAAERMSALEQTLFDQLYHDAQSAPDTESIRLLREALQIRPGATEPRVLLAQKLVAAKQYDEARRELDPLLNGADVDRAEVQEALAEIDAGRGRYQEAIVRYDRLSRRNRDPRYVRRLDELKEEFASANMPAHYRRALESESITRADFAVLLYWRVASVRFAQNLGAPPIATDLADALGREELVRAMALGIFNVDPVTRRVGPGATVNAASLEKLVARVLIARGATCARGPNAPANDPAKVLAACGLPDPVATAATPDAPVSGRTAAALLEKVDRALSL